MSSENQKDWTWIAFDTETSGKYPVGSELCEIAAVKWRGGQIVDTFQSLIETAKPMSDEVIKIHGISNEMLKGAPSERDVLEKFLSFVGDAPLLAHHAPFDLGFLSYSIEKYGWDLPKNFVLCTSLLSRTVIPESPNHRLQTLVAFLGIQSARAHRALDDSKACLELGLECFKRAKTRSLEELQGLQGVDLSWERFSLGALGATGKTLVRAIESGDPSFITYRSGGRPGKERLVYPEGLVRNPQGDYLVARDDRTSYPKRFFWDKIESAREFD